MNIAHELDRLTQPIAASKVKHFRPEEIAMVAMDITPPERIPFLHQMGRLVFPAYQGKDKYRASR